MSYLIQDSLETMEVLGNFFLTSLEELKRKKTDTGLLFEGFKVYFIDLIDSRVTLLIPIKH